MYKDSSRVYDLYSPTPGSDRVLTLPVDSDEEENVMLSFGASSEQDSHQSWRGQ